MRHSLTLIVLLLLVMALAAPALAAPAMQATATPDPTATPRYSTEVELSSGRLMTVERQWSLGEAATFLAVVALVIVEVAQVVTGYAARWTR